jgi:hypothetical protein
LDQAIELGVIDEVATFADLMHWFCDCFGL